MFAVINIIIIILLVVFLFLVHRNKKIEKFGNLKQKQCLILKTHTWNSDLENFAKKLLRETKESGLDFYVLMHSEDGSLKNKIYHKKLKDLTHIFTEYQIRNIYNNVGFISMWLSNHWILMWFYKNFGNQYQYIWTIEYDVRISGDSKKIWNYTGSEDFLYPIDYFQDINWKYKNDYTGNVLNDSNKYYGYLQLARYSNNFLSYLDNTYTSGENGQDEMMAFSLFKRGNFSGSKYPLNNYIQNTWSVDFNQSENFKNLYKKSEEKYKKDPNHLQIFHPIK